MLQKLDDRLDCQGVKCEVGTIFCSSPDCFADCTAECELFCGGVRGKRKAAPFAPDEEAAVCSPTACWQA